MKTAPRPMRVALTLEQLWHRVPGGTGIAALGIARSLVWRDDVEPIGVSARHRSPPAPGWVPPVEVRALPLPRVALYETWHRLRRPAVQRATGPVQVIHAVSLAVPPRTAPLVVMIHDLAFLEHPEQFTSHGVRFFHRGLALAQRDADLVVCPSEATRRACLRAGLDAARLRVVPLAVDLEPASDEAVAAVRRRYDLPQRYVLWSGTIEPRKNLGGLLRAFKATDADVDLVLVGPRGWNEDLDGLVDGIRDRVRWLGFVPRADLAALYAGAAAFCWPSLLEGFGLPVLEAMTQGTPVITSRGTSTEELASDAALLVDPRDMSELRHAISSICNDEPLARKLAEAGRARAAEYTWERTAEMLVDAYREVAA